MENTKSSNYFMFALMGMWIVLMFLMDILHIFEVNLGPIGRVLLSQIVLFVPLIVFIIIKKRHIPINNLLLFKKISIKNIIMIVGMTLALIPGAMLLGMLSSFLFGGNDVGEIVTDMTVQTGLWVSLFVAAVVPSFFEEIALRGIIFSGYKGEKIITAALINGLFFGIIHLNMQQFLYAFALGAIFCLFVYYTKSVWAGIIAHLTVNGTQTALTYFALQTLDEEAFLGQEYAASYAGQSDFLASFLIFAVWASAFLAVFILIFKSFQNYNSSAKDDPNWFKGNKMGNFFDIGFFGSVLIFAAITILIFAVQ